MNQFRAQRIRALEAGLDLQIALLADYEQQRDLTDDPRTIVRCEVNTERCRKDIMGYLEEYTDLTIRELVRSLDKLERQGETFGNAEAVRESIGNVNVKLNSKIELALPLIPGLLAYKVELGSDVTDFLSGAYKRFRGILSYKVF